MNLYHRKLKRLNNLMGNTIQRNQFLNRVYFSRLLWHTEHHAGRFILADGSGPGLSYFQQAFSPIRSHSGHNNTYGIGTCIFGN